MPENEKAVLEEALENLREAAQRIRATSNLMRFSGLREDPNHHDLAPRVASALAMTEAAGMEERGAFVREGEMQVGPGDKYFVLVDGDFLGGLLIGHFGLPEERGYTDLGRVRVTVERLEQ